jgi:putative flavoprotein involved in K+ transport
MVMEEIDTLVIGAGQAGIAASEHLGRAGIAHVVLERARIAERWRSERWDSLVTNGPVWHDRFPGLEFAATAPDGFAPKEEVADYLTAYAQMIAAPIRSASAARSVRRRCSDSARARTGRGGARGEGQEWCKVREGWKEVGAGGGW